MVTYTRFKNFIMPWLALALAMNMTRFAMTDVYSYIYMNWNLFLALVPLLFVFFFEKVQNIYLKALFFFAWLFFLPNAAYIITDLIHLRDVGPEWMLWYDGMMLFVYALLGIVLGVYSTLRIKKSLGFGNYAGKLFSAVVAVLSGFGIYLGRYIRWNSWDLVTRPMDVATNIFHVVGTEYFNPVFVTTIVFFALFILAAEYSLRFVFVENTT